jgi:hypothetical protein
VAYEKDPGAREPDQADRMFKVLADGYRQATYPRLRGTLEAAGIKLAELPLPSGYYLVAIIDDLMVDVRYLCQADLHLDCDQGVHGGSTKCIRQERRGHAARRHS